MPTASSWNTARRAGISRQPGAESVTEGLLDGLRAKRAELDARLDEPDAAAKQDTLKADIGSLIKTIDCDLRELGALREAALALAEQWKGVRANGCSLAPHRNRSK